MRVPLRVLMSPLMSLSRLRLGGTAFFELNSFFLSTSMGDDDCFPRFARLGIFWTKLLVLTLKNLSFLTSIYSSLSVLARPTVKFLLNRWDGSANFEENKREIKGSVRVFLYFLCYIRSLYSQSGNTLVLLHFACVFLRCILSCYYLLAVVFIGANSV